MSEDSTRAACEHVAARFADVAIHTNTMQPSDRVIRGAVKVGAPLAAHRGYARRHDIGILVRWVDGLQSCDHRSAAVLASMGSHASGAFAISVP